MSPHITKKRKESKTTTVQYMFGAVPALLFKSPDLSMRASCKRDGDGAKLENINN